MASGLPIKSLMWAQKIIASVNVGREFAIESFNLVPLNWINAGRCDYEFGSLQLVLSARFQNKGYYAATFTPVLKVFDNRKDHCNRHNY